METESSPPQIPAQAAQAQKARRLLLRVVFLFLLINGVILYRVLQEPKPTYNGLTVAGWCKRINLGPLEPQVVNAFGPGAASLLVEVVDAKRSLLKRGWSAIWRRIPDALRKKISSLQPYDVVGARGTAVQWLIELGADGREAIPGLMHIAQHANDVYVRCSAMSALSFVGADSPEALKVLVNLLNDPDVVITDNAALRLGQMGPAAKNAVPALARYLESHPQGKPFNPITALGYIGPTASEGVPAIVRALKDPEFHANSLYALNRIGAGAGAAVPSLVPFLEHEDPRFRVLALDTLRQLGPLARPALTDLLNVRKTRIGVERVLAAVVIANIERDSRLALPILLEEFDRGGSDAGGSWQLQVPSFTRSEVASYGILSPDAAAWFLGWIPRIVASPRARFGGSTKTSIPYGQSLRTCFNRERTSRTSSTSILRCKSWLKSVLPPNQSCLR